MKIKVFLLKICYGALFFYLGFQLFNNPNLFEKEICLNFKNLAQICKEENHKFNENTIFFFKFLGGFLNLTTFLFIFVENYFGFFAFIVWILIEISKGEFNIERFLGIFGSAVIFSSSFINNYENDKFIENNLKNNHYQFSLGKIKNKVIFDE